MAISKGSVHVNSEGLNEVIGEWAVISGPISFQITSRREKVLADFFANTQERTHVITGSLKSSGLPESDYDGDQWNGAITYGGALWQAPTPGPANDPVEYAVYEMARGGDHDFFGDAPYYIQKFEDVVNEFIPDAK